MKPNNPKIKKEVAEARTQKTSQMNTMQNKETPCHHATLTNPIS